MEHKDFKGIPLKVGDRVAYATTSYQRAYLRAGTIEKFDYPTEYARKRGNERDIMARVVNDKEGDAPRKPSVWRWGRDLLALVEPGGDGDL